MQSYLQKILQEGGRIYLTVAVYKTSRRGYHVLPVSRFPEVTGGYPEFAKLVREVTGEVTRGAAANHAGVSHDTIARMWRGDRVGRSVVIQFAQGYRVNPNPLLEALEYPLIDLNSLEEPTAEIEYIRDDDERTIIKYFRGMPPEIRGTAVESFRNLKTAADLMAERQSERSISGRKAGSGPPPPSKIVPGEDTGDSE